MKTGNSGICRIIGQNALMNSKWRNSPRKPFFGFVESNLVALIDLFFYWPLWSIASIIVIGVRGIAVRVGSSIVSFSNQSHIAKKSSISI